MGYNQWGHKELDVTEWLTLSLLQLIFSQFLYVIQGMIQNSFIAYRYENFPALLI